MSRDAQNKNCKWPKHVASRRYFISHLVKTAIDNNLGWHQLFIDLNKECTALTLLLQMCYLKIASIAKMRLRLQVIPRLRSYVATPIPVDYTLWNNCTLMDRRQEGIIDNCSNMWTIGLTPPFVQLFNN